MTSERRPRLTPAVADVRRAVRGALLPLVERAETSRPALPPPPASEPNEGVFAAEGDLTAQTGDETAQTPSFGVGGGPAAGSGGLVLVALSGGPDSLALAAATAFVAPRAGLLAGAVIVDHNLQPGSADVAAAAERQAVNLGLDPVLLRRVKVGATGGPEAAARDARYTALAEAAAETGAAAVLLGHTLDDQAETVLLGLARGSGSASLQGMDRRAGLYLRPLLGIHRQTTRQFCVDAGLTPWTDPQNSDPVFTRVRVRERVLPLLEDELGPGVAEALARTADQLREDNEALDHFAEEVVEELAEVAEAGISLPVRALESNPAALRQRLIRLVVEGEFHVSLSRAQTLEVARLVTHWHGQGAVDLPGIRVERRGGLLIFSANG